MPAKKGGRSIVIDGELHQRIKSLCEEKSRGGYKLKMTEFVEKTLWERVISEEKK